MPLKSAPYYWLECDGCGEKFHCPMCPPLDVENVDACEPDALSRALMKSRPELTGHVHYVNGRPWCDGVNHTTMCQPEDAEVTA